MSHDRAVTIPIADKVIASIFKSWKPQANGATKLRKWVLRLVSTDKFIWLGTDIAAFQIVGHTVVSPREVDGRDSKFGHLGLPGDAAIAILAGVSTDQALVLGLNLNAREFGVHDHVAVHLSTPHNFSRESGLLCWCRRPPLAPCMLKFGIQVLHRT